MSPDATALRTAARELLDYVRLYAELCRDCHRFIDGFRDDAAQQPAVGQLLARLDEAVPTAGALFPWEKAPPSRAAAQDAALPVADLASFQELELATRPGALAP
jgi:hypothetical protein